MVPENAAQASTMLDIAWKRKPGKIDWLEFEDLVRYYLNAAYDGNLAKADALNWINQAIGACTKRGTAYEGEIV